jgi:L,D-transpeptidase ErfK/SrfK
VGPPRPGVVVNLPERGFYVFSGGDPRFFPIAVGEPGRFATPTGLFSIIEKVENPDWVAPEWAGLGEDNVVKAGPDNPLGDRWIGLSSSGLGMHSTNNPASIGSATSHGCMRMYPEVARTVFDLVRTGWPVRIEYKTSRVGLDRSGIYVAAFPDIYNHGNRIAQLREQFGRDDLLGFYSEETCRPILESPRGLPVRIVDLSPKAWFGKDWFPAARIGPTLFVEQGLLEAAGVVAEYSLAERVVRLTHGNRAVSLPLYLPSELDRQGDQPFLSRGSGWYPARKTLSDLGLSMTWEAAENRLRVQ